MKTYIALLRAINVSGKNIILMKDLKTLFEDLDFENVKTYIQSGNVIFESDKNKELLAELISNKIKTVYDYDVPVIILTKNELQVVIENNPFLIEDENIDTKKLYVSYLNQIPKETKKLDDFDFRQDKYIIKDKVIYLKYDLGAGRTKLSNKIIENKLDCIATARNWRTTCKLLEL
jgi:uncharacterized protein (DUF1697 family)